MMKMKTANILRKIAIYALPLFVLSSLALAGETTSDRKPVPQDALIVDVRTEAEYQSGHYPGAKNIPLSRITDRILEFGPTDKTVVVYCRSGRRSGIAEKILKDAGYLNTINGGGLHEMLRQAQDNQ